MFARFRSLESKEQGIGSLITLALLLMQIEYDNLRDRFFFLNAVEMIINMDDSFENEDQFIFPLKRKENEK